MGKTLTGFIQVVVGITLIMVGIVTGISFLWKLGAVFVLSGISTLLSPSPSLSNPLEDGQRLRLRISPVEPRAALLGRNATGGLLVFRDTYGEDNKFLSLVVVVGGHEFDTVAEKFYWANDLVTFTGDNANAPFSGVMSLFKKTGIDAQTDFAELTSASSKWTTAHRLRGLPAIHLKLTFDRDKFPNGVQQFIIVNKGAKIYDPRLDTTNGGSGPQRLTDQSTWVWSNNPILCIVHYMRGFLVANSTTTSYDGTRVIGVGIADDRFDWAHIRAEADVCDETVDLKAGGNQTRYTCDGYVDPRNQHRVNLENLMTSCAGRVTLQNGLWRVFAGAPRVATKTRGINDVLSPISYRLNTGLGQKFNTVTGVFADEDDQFNAKNLPLIEDTAAVTEDYNQALIGNIDLLFTTNHIRGQRILQIALKSNRVEENLDLTFSPIALQDEAMDSINFSYDRLNIVTSKWLIADWVMSVDADEDGNLGFLIREKLELWPDSIFDWTPATDEQALVAGAKLNRNDAIIDSRKDPVLSTIGVISIRDMAILLTATDAGATATISIAAHNVEIGAKTIAYPSGSLTGLSFNIRYFIYMDDPGLDGGGTYIVTTNSAILGQGNHRYYVGSIVTPADGAGDTSGSGGGSVGGTGGTGSGLGTAELI